MKYKLLLFLVLAASFHVYVLGDSCGPFGCSCDPDSRYFDGYIFSCNSSFAFPVIPIPFISYSTRPKMTQIILSGISLSSIASFDTAFSNFASTVDTIDVANNQIRSLPSNLFSRFSSLKTLNLTGNSINASDSVSLLDGPNPGSTLTTLYIGLYAPYTVSPSLFSGLESLTELTLSTSYLNLSEHAAGLLAPLINLEKLDVAELDNTALGFTPTTFTTLPSWLIRNLKKLRSITVSGSRHKLEPGFFYGFSNVALFTVGAFTSCPSSTFDDMNSCQPCNGSCYECSASSDNCTSCAPTEYLNWDGTSGSCSSTPSSSSSSVAVIAAAVGGGGGLLLLIVLLVVLQRKRRSRRGATSLQATPSKDLASSSRLNPPLKKKDSVSIPMTSNPPRNPYQGDPAAPSVVAPPPAVAAAPQPSSAAIDEAKILLKGKELQRQDVVIGAFLGSGEFGKVFSGTLVRDGQQVAVKTLRDTSSVLECENFLGEAQLMADLDHPNILKILGVCMSPGGPLLIVLEYMALGDLNTYLRSMDDSKPDRSGMLSACLQISRAMEYLEKRKLVHRDLATRNCLITVRPGVAVPDDLAQQLTKQRSVNSGSRTGTGTGGGMESTPSSPVSMYDNDGMSSPKAVPLLSLGKLVVKIADFGLSRDVYESDYYTKESKGRIPIKWLSLEAILKKRYTTASDAWAFGVLMWEIFSFGSVPYPGVANREIPEYLQEGHRLKRPPGCDDGLFQIMSSCWRANPDERPTFKELSLSLERLEVYDN